MFLINSSISSEPSLKPTSKSKMSFQQLRALIAAEIHGLNQTVHRYSMHQPPMVDSQSNYTNTIDNYLDNSIDKVPIKSSHDGGSNHLMSEEYGAVTALAAILFVFGLTANLAVIGRVLRQGVLRARIRMLLLSLSCADVLLMMMEFPLNQFAWLSMRSWKAGDFTCRASMFARAFAAYLISFILVVISLDRCLNTVKPAAPKAASRRMKKLLWCALLFAVLCALPQWLIFHAHAIPHNPTEYQCVSRGLTEDDNMIKVVYPLYSMICQYIIPIVLISLDYTIILYAMSKPVGQSDFQQLISFRQVPSTITTNTTSIHGNTTNHNNNNINTGTCSSPSSNNLSISHSTSHASARHNSSHDSYIRKAQMKTLRILLVTVAVFATCWLPYYLVMLIHIANPRLDGPFWLYKTTEMLALSNACLNPFIYGNYLLKVKERCKGCWPF